MFAAQWRTGLEFAPVTGDTITIAITVYDRSGFVGQAIRSAANQQQDRAREILVVEDCGPNPDLRSQLLAEFGDSIRYHRNPARRGLFDNWNSCLEQCTTDWLCILHDDDFLAPNFIVAMKELAAAAPGRALYYGKCRIVDEHDQVIRDSRQPEAFAWHELDPQEWALHDPVCFPAQLFNVQAARTLGGFRARSHYCADWEMWFKLATTYGAAATNRVIANYREYVGTGRGTTRVDLSGRKYALVNAQRKRFVHALRQRQPSLRFDRRRLQRSSPMPTTFLLQHGSGFSDRMMRYNTGLLLLSGAPNPGYRLFQIVVRIFGWRFVRVLSSISFLKSKAHNRGQSSIGASL